MIATAIHSPVEQARHLGEVAAGVCVELDEVVTFVDGDLAGFAFAMIDVAGQGRFYLSVPLLKPFVWDSTHDLARRILKHTHDLHAAAGPFGDFAAALCRAGITFQSSMITAARFIAGDSNAGIYAALFVRSLPILTANGFDQFEVRHG